MPPRPRSPRTFFALLSLGIASAAGALLLPPVAARLTSGENLATGTAPPQWDIGASLRPVENFRDVMETALACDASGDLWVTARSQLQRLSSRGVPRLVRDLGMEPRVDPGHSMAPLAGVALSSGVVWVVSRSGQIRAWDDTGARSVRASLQGPVTTPPQTDHRGGLYVAGGNHLYRVSRGGDVTRLLSTPGRIGGLSTFDEGRGAAVTAHDGSLCLRPADDKPTRCTLAPARLDAPPTVTEERVFAAGEDGHVFAFDRPTLSPFFEVTLGGHVRSGLTVVGDRLLMQTFGPRPALFTLSARDGQILATLPLPLLDHSEQGSRHAPLLVADDLLLTLGPANAALLTDSHGRLRQWLPLKGSELASAVRSPRGQTFIAAGRRVYALDL